MMSERSIPRAANSDAAAKKNQLSNVPYVRTRKSYSTVRPLPFFLFSESLVFHLECRKFQESTESRDPLLYIRFKAKRAPFIPSMLTFRPLARVTCKKLQLIRKI